MGGQLGDTYAPLVTIYRNSSTNLGDASWGFWYSRHTDSAVGIAISTLDTPGVTGVNYSLHLKSGDGHNICINPNNGRKPKVTIILMEVDV